jgi:hypothetical protein
MNFTNSFNHPVLNNAWGNKQKRAQSAMEFTLMIGFAIFFLILVIVAMEDIISEQYSKREDLALKSTALSVVNEISMAYSSSEGYEREFYVPADSDFQINLTEGFVYAQKGSRSTAYPAYPVTGNLQKGTNTIRKINNSVFLN